MPEPDSRPEAQAPGEPSGRPAPVLELEATYPEGFSFLNGVRELSDGTVLVADPLAQLLLRIDLDSSTADTLGRVGPGPQEYQQPDRVFPLPGDSSLLVDLGKMLLTEITPEGTFANSLPMSIPRGDAFPIVLQPRFVDNRGRLYDQAGRSREAGHPDSAAVIRFDRGTRRLDTVGTVWLPAFNQTRSRGGGFLPRMLESMDAWAIGNDGRLAIVRARDFSVEWRLPDGRRVEGPAHDVPTQTVSRGDKEAILVGMRSSGISMTSAVSRTGGVQQMTMRRGIPNSGDGPGVDEFEWAETFPPFRPEGAAVSPLGEVWVERWMPVDSDSRWEVFGEDGHWIGSVALPPGRSLIGFGKGPDSEGVAYVTYSDEYDLRWLERYGIVR